MYWKSLEGNSATATSEQKSDIKTGSLLTNTVVIHIA